MRTPSKLEIYRTPRRKWFELRRWQFDGAAKRPPQWELWAMTEGPWWTLYRQSWEYLGSFKSELQARAAMERLTVGHYTNKTLYTDEGKEARGGW